MALSIPLPFKQSLRDPQVALAVSKGWIKDTAQITLNLRVLRVDDGVVPRCANCRPLQGVFRTNPERGMRIEALLPDLMDYQDQLLRWLSLSTENRQVFANDPVTAIKLACNAPEALLERIRQVRPQPPVGGAS